MKRKPPLGVCPYYIWTENYPDPDFKDVYQRFVAVREAIQRYREQNLTPKKAWLEELGLLPEQWRHLL